MAGSWVAAVNLPDLGVVAAHELGITLERFVLVPWPGRWFAEAAAVLVDAIDVTLLRAPANLPPAVARRLRARVRERGTILIALGSWPDPPDLVLAVTRGVWRGLGDGHGHLGERQAEVRVAGRGVASQGRRARLLLPGSAGAVATLPATAAEAFELALGGQRQPSTHRQVPAG